MDQHCADKGAGRGDRISCRDGSIQIVTKQQPAFQSDRSGSCMTGQEKRWLFRIFLSMSIDCVSHACQRSWERSRDRNFTANTRTLCLSFPSQHKCPHSPTGRVHQLKLNCLPKKLKKRLLRVFLGSVWLC